MEIRFGRPIVSSDGARVGVVDTLVLDRETRTARAMIVLYGIDERAIPVKAIQHVNDDGIIDLNLTAADIHQIPLARNGGASNLGAGQRFMPYTSWVSGESTAPSFSGGMYVGQPHNPPAADDRDPDVVEIDGEIVVAGLDGKIVGTIAGVEVDESGAVQELIIGTGFLRPDIRVAMDSVEYVEGGYVSHML